MKVWLTILLCFCMLNVCACSATQSTKIIEVSFGTSGGFTNQTSTYRLTRKGKLFYNDRFIKQVDDKTNQEVFDLVKTLGDPISDSGNMMLFIEVRTKSETKTYIWSSNGKYPELDRIRKQINTLLL